MPLHPIFPGNVFPTISNCMFRFVSPDMGLRDIAHQSGCHRMAFLCQQQPHNGVGGTTALCLLRSEIILMSAWYQLASVEFFMVILLMLS